MAFVDRSEAGRQLAASLAEFADQDVVVLGLPRGGVVVAAEVADALRAPLDVIVVRKLGFPSQPELAMGAIGEGGAKVINAEGALLAREDPEGAAAVERYEREELARRATCFRGERDRVSIKGKTVIVVDDGIATGATIRVACEVARAQGAMRVVAAAPIAPASVVIDLATVADKVVCPHTPRHFHAIGQWYDDFSPTPDDEVVEILQRHPINTSGAPKGATGGAAQAADLGTALLE
jgi:putative phosphoribosyl transferase